MITLIDKIIPEQIGTNSLFNFSEEGDTLILQANQPTIGILNITGYSFISTGETSNNYLDKYFRCTVDGIHWDNWKPLDINNLLNLSIKKNHFFDIEYRFTKVGSSTDIQFESIQLIFNYELPPIPENYNNYYFSKYFSYYNNDSIRWSLNVLEKIFKPGIVPRYIQRKLNERWEDEDYINIWWTIIYSVALKLTYNKVFVNLVHYTDLLKKYLEQRGLYFGSNESFDELYYLSTRFYDEVSKRGSICIFDKKRILPSNFENVFVRGEFLRLIDYQEFDELVLGLIPSEKQGWIVGWTSPMFHMTDFYKNYIKAYENEIEIINIENYPLTLPQYITQQKITVPYYNRVLEINALKINTNAENYSGIGFDMSKLITIDTELDYCISFKAKSEKTFSLRFGAKVYDSINNEGGLINYSTKRIEEFFYEGAVETTTDSEEEDFYFCGVIFGRSTSNIYNSISPDGRSTNLQFTSESTIKLLPEILIASRYDTYIYDIKVELLTIDQNVYMTSNSEMNLYIKNNNSNYTNNELYQIVSTYLVPYSFNINLQLL